MLHLVLKFNIKKWYLTLFIFIALEIPNLTKFYPPNLFIYLFSFFFNRNTKKEKIIIIRKGSTKEYSTHSNPSHSLLHSKHTFVLAKPMWTSLTLFLVSYSLSALNAGAQTSLQSITSIPRDAFFYFSSYINKPKQTKINSNSLSLPKPQKNQPQLPPSPENDHSFLSLSHNFFSSRLEN